jgi:hypothetical protein
MVLGEVFESPVSEGRAEAYFALLQDLSWPQVQAAIRQAATRLKFFPKPAEIREAIQGRTPDRTAHLIAQARQAARTYGYMAQPDLPAVTLRAILAVFGSWSSFCGAEWTTHEQHRFTETLNGLQESEAVRGAPELPAAPGAKQILAAVRTATAVPAPKPHLRVIAKPAVLSADFDEDARRLELQRQAARLRGEA